MNTLTWRRPSVIHVLVVLAETTSEYELVMFNADVTLMRFIAEESSRQLEFYDRRV